MEEPIKTTEPEKPENGKSSNYGGAREGSGRKPKEKLPGKFNARELFYKKIDDRWEMLMKAVDEIIADRDKDMIKFVIEQRIGKAPTSVSMELSGTVALQQMEQDIKNLLYGHGVKNNTEVSGEVLQDGRGEAPNANPEPVPNVSVNNNQERATPVAECSHEVREIFNGSSGSLNKSN